MDPLRLQLRMSAAFYGFLLGRRFKSFGKNSRLISPLKIDGIENIEIGDDVTIGYKSWLAAVCSDTAAKLTISSGSTVGSFNEIYAINHIEIGKNVLTADNVYISDNSHDYEHIDSPIMRQRVKGKGRVVIRDGAWLGRNAVVIGASIGKNSVVGANSVVLSDIPDFSVAAGSPAKILRTYDHTLGSWIRL